MTHIHSYAMPTPTPSHPLIRTEIDFDVLVGGHLTRLGTKEDVQDKVDYFADILAGSELGHATVSIDTVAMGMGITGPDHELADHTWCVRTNVNRDDRCLSKISTS